MYDTYDLFGTGVSESVRKTAAFLFQNIDTEIARVLGIDDVKAMKNTLSKMRKEFRKSIDDNGGGYDEYINAVTLREEVTAYNQVTGEFDSAGLQDDHKTLAFIGATVQTFTFVPINVQKEGFLGTCQRYAHMRNEYRAKRVPKQQITNACTLRKKYKDELLGMKSIYNNWLQSASDRINLSDLLLSNAPSHALDVLWAYLKMISKDEQVNMSGVGRGIKLKVFYDAFPELANLEQRESRRERRYRRRVLELDSTDYKKAKYLKKYKAERAYTALTYAKLWLDPNKDRSKRLLRYLQKMVNEDEKEKESKRESEKHRGRRRRSLKAKAGEKRFAGGRYNIDELKNAGMALLAKQVKS